MLIVCPSCASEYTIGADRIGPTGRVVRCASCREAWFIAPEDVAQETERASASEAAAARGQNGPRGARNKALAPSHDKAALVLSLCLVMAMAMAAVFRTTLVRIAPESAAVFAAVGLPVNLLGLQLSGVKSDIGQEGEAQVLVVTGEIANETDRPKQVPPVAFTIEGENGATLYSWTDKSTGGEIAPHATARFQARLASPPPDGRHVLVTFSGKAGSPAVASR
ncbi:MAG TPA: zinc-ribbon domain-containing protein [Enterovirga sp.]|jgi:predicted Zn finger-like uncharacterized protein